jgi:hypothetical protein
MCYVRFGAYPNQYAHTNNCKKQLVEKRKKEKEKKKKGKPTAQIRGYC